MARVRMAAGGALLLLCGGCRGGGDTGPGPGPSSPILAKAAPSGDGQSGPTGTTLAQELRVIITKDASPLAGVTVNWEVQATDGSAAPSSTVTGADGIASTRVTLPPFASTIAVVATAPGAAGSPLRFTVTSTGATDFVTVLVTDNEFQPDNFALKAGGRVTFIWQSGAGPHNVTPVPPATAPASTNPPPPGTHYSPYNFEVRFPAPGTFSFFCGVHGGPGSGMHGIMIVVP